MWFVEGKTSHIFHSALTVAFMQHCDSLNIGIQINLCGFNEHIATS